MESLLWRQISWYAESYDGAQVRRRMSRSWSEVEENVGLRVVSKIA